MSTNKPRTKKIKSNLDYHFTKAELLSLGKELGESQLKLRQLDDDRKMVADEWKAKISSAEAHINSLSNKTSTGYEYRDVSCTVTFDDPAPGEKTVRRDDTGDIVKVMLMHESEKQDELPFEEETKPEAEGGLAAEGTTVTISGTGVDPITMTGAQFKAAADKIAKKAK